MSRADFTDTRRAEDFAIKTVLICVYIYIVSDLHREGEKKRKKKKKERKKEVPGEEWGRNNQNATRIRWDPTPEREKRQELERRVLGKRVGERRRRKRGERFDISLVTTRF